MEQEKTTNGNAHQGHTHAQHPPLTRDQFLVRALRFVLAKPPGTIFTGIQLARELDAAGITAPGRGLGQGTCNGLIAMAKSRGVIAETGHAVKISDIAKGGKDGRGHFRPTYKRTNVLDIAFPSRFKDIH